MYYLYSHKDGLIIGKIANDEPAPETYRWASKGSWFAHDIRKFDELRQARPVYFNEVDYLAWAPGPRGPIVVVPTLWRLSKAESDYLNIYTHIMLDESMTPFLTNDPAREERAMIEANGEEWRGVAQMFDELAPYHLINIADALNEGRGFVYLNYWQRKAMLGSAEGGFSQSCMWIVALDSKGNFLGVTPSIAAEDEN